MVRRDRPWWIFLMVELFDAVRHLDPHRAVILVAALTIAFGFEVVNGFHDTANAVTTQAHLGLEPFSGPAPDAA
jgi:hypothetical protein